MALFKTSHWMTVVLFSVNAYININIIELDDCCVVNFHNVMNVQQNQQGDAFKNRKHYKVDFYLYYY